MQASLLVAPQMQAAAAQPPLLAQPLANVAAQALLALPGFDAVMAKAMASVAQVDPAAAPTVPPTADQQVMPTVTPGTPRGATLQPLPPPMDVVAATPMPVMPSAPLPAAVASVTVQTDETAAANQAAATETAIAPVALAVQVAAVAPAAAAAPVVVDAPGSAKGTSARKAEASEHPRPAREDQSEAASETSQPAVALPAVALLAELPVQAAPDATPPAAAPSGARVPAARPRMNLGEAISEAAKEDAPAEKLAAATQQPSAAPRPSEAPSIVLNDLAPTDHGHASATPAAPSIQPSPPVSDLSANLPPPPAASPVTPAAATPEPASVASQQSTAPAAQLAPVLVSMAHGPDGAPRMTIRLDPPELGHVQVRIDRPLDAPAHVEITVEKSETLTLLLRDQPQLQRALDQAGVPPDGRSVTIHIAAAEPGSRSDGPAAPLPGAASTGPAGDGSHGAARQGSGSPRHDTGNPDDDEVDPVHIALPAWLRGGLDITA